MGLDGRTRLLALLLLGEGVGLLIFSQAEVVGIAVLSMLAFGLFTHMACGALYALVPFVDRKVLGGVAGIVGAGGNIGGVAAGFLLRGTGSIPECLYILGYAAIVCAGGALTIRFSAAHKAREEELYAQAVALREAVAMAAPA
jgi:NNP family nitrate/nitrite transporter-like MFS transporter